MPATPGFADRLKSAMGDMTNAALARASGVSRATIIDWLGGALPAQPEKVRQVADALGVPFDVLWGDAAGLVADERTRLMQLEDVVRRVREVLGEIVAEPAPKEVGVRHLGANRVVGDGAATSPPRKRAKGES